jgi:tRNA (cytidine/uridine-2'-O-)-methyltransferase
MFRIVLFEPEIPPNTGNVIRLCANTGAELHLIKPLGFDLDRRSLRRAGLDYRWMARVHVHDDFAACERALGAAPQPLRWCAIETGGARRYDEVAYAEGDALLFGSERRGLPDEVLERIGPQSLASIPMQEGNRSLNLSNSVAVVVYEAWRQNGFRAAGGQPPA